MLITTGVGLSSVTSKCLSSVQISNTNYQWSIIVDDDFDKNTPGYGKNRFSTIRSAVHSAIDGNRILIKKGQYKEIKLEIDKSITLHGEEGVRHDHIDSPWVLSHEPGRYIFKIETSGVVIENLYISGLFCDEIERGVYITREGANCKIYNNRIQGFEWGVKTWGPETIIKNNYFWDNVDDIYTSGDDHRCRIELNDISAGICINSDNNMILKNYISSSARSTVRIDGSGIWIIGNKNNICYNNILSCKSNGITIYDGRNNSIYNNDILYNGMYGIYIRSHSSNNVIYKNNFQYPVGHFKMAKNNLGGAYSLGRLDDHTTNRWDYKGNGNYWGDEYVGLGFKPHDIPGKRDLDGKKNDEWDNYPLLGPGLYRQSEGTNKPMVIQKNLNNGMTHIFDTQITSVFTQILQKILSKSILASLL
jgi:nitrous oxidase accessory protein